MADINFTVSTRPLAERIDGVTKEVGVVGVAVTAMQAAVIASEKEASDTICQSIDSGFYLLMRSRFSQRLAQFSSTMNSRIGSMLETAQAIDRTHQQMRGDFNRIKSRYVKLFDGLDQKLEERVRELDRDAMALASKRSTLLMESQCREVPTALYCAADTHTVALKATGAHVKSLARDSIGYLSDGAHHIIDHEATLKRILDEEQSTDGAPVSVISVPVVYAHEESLASPDTYALSVVAPTALPSSSRDEITSCVRRNVSTLGATRGQQASRVRMQFVEKIAGAQLDQRVAETMLKLFDASFGATSTNGAYRGTGLSTNPEGSVSRFDADATGGVS